ncbi:hypothetical protein B0J13DRAFT_227365 [Dactylonectria estremocensis]|uniref:Uncharacterized protein n=1 Tax=Dactylonectria estremocensis TaxID=1079267 RepID=A0A9P9F897_9HYPO|nr:hypothetical protein B0J13DRAFT_227365 [Dactylonectria estremocensis]
MGSAMNRQLPLLALALEPTCRCRPEDLCCSLHLDSALSCQHKPTLYLTADLSSHACGCTKHVPYAGHGHLMFRILCSACCDKNIPVERTRAPTTFGRSMPYGGLPTGDDSPPSSHTTYPTPFIWNGVPMYSRRFIDDVGVIRIVAQSIWCMHVSIIGVVLESWAWGFPQPHETHYSGICYPTLGCETLNAVTCRSAASRDQRVGEGEQADRRKASPCLRNSHPGLTYTALVLAVPRIREHDGLEQGHFGAKPELGHGLVTAKRCNSADGEVDDGLQTDGLTV